MKIVIEKQYDELGGEFLQQDEVVAEMYTNDDELIIKVDGVLYAIPKLVIKALVP